jgi:hypothetical protein
MNSEYPHSRDPPPATAPVRGHPTAAASGWRGHNHRGARARARDREKRRLTRFGHHLPLPARPLVASSKKKSSVERKGVSQSLPEGARRRTSDWRRRDVGIGGADAGRHRRQQHRQGAPEEGHPHPPSPLPQAQGSPLPLLAFHRQIPIAPGRAADSLVGYRAPVCARR